MYDLILIRNLLIVYLIKTNSVTTFTDSVLSNECSIIIHIEKNSKKIKHLLPAYSLQHNGLLIIECSHDHDTKRLQFTALATINNNGYF